MKKTIIISLIILLALASFNFNIPKAKAGIYDYTGKPAISGSNFISYCWNIRGSGTGATTHYITTTGTITVNGHSENVTGAGSVCALTANGINYLAVNPLLNGYVVPKPSTDNLVLIHVSWTGAYAGSWNWEGKISVNSSGVPTSVTPDTWSTLAATISGPTSIDLVTAGTWTANASGGLPPYTYAWSYGKFPPNWIGSGTGTTLTQVLTAGNWTISLTVTDSIAGSVTTSLSVTAGTVAGSYTAHLTRSGALGNIIDIYVTDVTNTNVIISSTANTKLGYFTGDGAYHLDAAIAEAVQYITSWRWTTQVAIPPDMWFFSSVHLAVPNIDLAITHHFLTFNDGAVIVFGPTGAPTVPVELPPAPGSELPSWLQAVYDMLVKVFNFLFKPDSTEFSKQISSGWLNFQSPIPAISPTYIIAMPTMTMVAGVPTITSHNFDFSNIANYPGMATAKIIFQAILYMLLVYLAYTIFM